jgi:ABC-type transport system substrate-binding protein
MVRRGSLRRGLLGVFVLLAAVLPLSSGAAAAKSISNAAKTLNLSLPGPFNGCTFLDSSATPSTDAVSDLLLPSAFQTNGAGNLIGEGGPIASAELTSLNPETIRYTIAPNEQWSNGNTFNGNDLEGWWLRAKALTSVQSDGYRDIKTLTVSNNGLTVTAIFATPYADWNLLFRDVEELGTQSGCTMADLVARPTLGPYTLSSATSKRIVLLRRKKWPVDTNRFGRIVITDNGAFPSGATSHFVNFSLIVNRSLVQTVSSHPTVLSHIGASSNIEEISFAAARPFTRRIAVRRALSWAINRQSLINLLWGEVTFSPSVAASALYSQGQSNYPGQNGTGPTGQGATTTTVPSTTTNGLADCVSCAIAELSTNGFLRTAHGWNTISGAPLVLTLAVGPSDLDQTVAASLVAQWTSIGVKVARVDVRTEIAASVATATNSDDMAVFSRPTITAASYAARSWSGQGFADSFPSSWRSVAATALFTQGTSNFNPVTASSTWLKMDQMVQNGFWVRPLFTSPSLVEWSNSLVGLLGSFSVPGLVDQEPGWTTESLPAKG